MVRVYSTTLPHRSATVRLVVLMFSVSLALAPALVEHSPSLVATFPAGDRLGRGRCRVDAVGARGGEPVGQQPAQRDVHVRRVAEVLAAIGEGQRTRLEVAMQRLRIAHAAQPEALQDVQRLAHGRPTAGGGRHPVDVVAAVAHTGRGLVPHPVAGQVARLEMSRRARAASRRSPSAGAAPSARSGGRVARCRRRRRRAWRSSGRSRRDRGCGRSTQPQAARHCAETACWSRGGSRTGPCSPPSAG